MSEIIKSLGIFSGLASPNVKRRKRVGRGRGSGKGKTCGRGGKGQTARTGVSISWFEGGQTPLYRRLPRRGFNNLFRKEYNVINIQDVVAFMESGALSNEISLENLISLGFVKKDGLIKLLGSGKCSKSFTITVHSASKSAIDSVKSTGGEVKLLSN